MKFSLTATILLGVTALLAEGQSSKVTYIYDGRHSSRWKDDWAW